MNGINPRLLFRGRRRKLSQLDVPEPDLVAVILQQDVSARRVPESRDVFVLALGDERLHLRTADLERDDALAVEPVLDMSPADHEPCLVPLADRPCGVCGGWDQIVECACC